MSTTKTENDLKGLNVLPATKLAGGVRVSTRPHKSHSNEKARSNSESSDVEETPGSPKDNNPIISGRQTKGNKDFTSDAIKAFHEKPMRLSNEKVNGLNAKYVLQQPKKILNGLN